MSQRLKERLDRKKRYWAKRIGGMIASRGGIIDDFEADILDEVDPNISWQSNLEHFTQFYPELNIPTRKVRELAGAGGYMPQKATVQEMEEHYEELERGLLKIAEMLESYDCANVHSWIADLYETKLKPFFDEKCDEVCAAKVDLETSDLQEQLKQCLLRRPVEKIIKEVPIKKPIAKRLPSSKTYMNQFKKITLQKFLQSKGLPYSGDFNKVIERVRKAKFSPKEIHKHLDSLGLP